MAYEEFLTDNSLQLTDSQALKYILYLFNDFKKEKPTYNFQEDHNHIPENIISLYYHFASKGNVNIVFSRYKKRFIENESVVEPGVTPEEREGLGLIYDYISNFPEGKAINVFQESFNLHKMLYSKCPYSDFGATFRLDDVCLYDVPYDVLPGKEAIKKFALYTTNNISFNPDTNIFDYIDNCVKMCTDLIALQPFEDGNKRTFRALLNLMLRQASLPPIYIKKEERDIYKDKLIEAICDKNYDGICNFYHYKVADAIVGIGISSIDKENHLNDINSNNSKKKN